MPDILHFLPVIKLAAAFIIMLAAIRCRINLGISIIAGAATIALFFDLSPELWAGTAVFALSHPQTLMLSAIVLLILLLSDVLEKTGQTTRLMHAVSGHLRNPRLRLVFFPVLIGLLPMPGGAVFSAPMIGAVAEKMQLKDSTLTALNYWFRHIWETWWPLYPGIILAASMSGVPIATICLLGLPGMLVMVACGWYFLLRPAVLPLPEEFSDGKDAIPANSQYCMEKEGLPLLVAIAGAVFLETALSRLIPAIPFEVGIIVALAAGLMTAMLQNKETIHILKKALLRRHLWQMVLVIASIFIFKGVLDAAGVVKQLAKLGDDQVALTASTIILPFCVGAVSGITMAYVGATFPLIISLVAQAGMQEYLPAYIVLAIFSGFTGIMATPLHICFVLTCQYFRCSLGSAWRKIAPACLVLFCCGLAYHSLLLLSL
ncbi:DUF401 family protein [Oleidesulfovibrio sp.]|uniref:DUF401 family protein n=1 Tax=Oleidesulfovibrio sp. TaxID=2909707 RepID=UPI003A88C0A6